MTIRKLIISLAGTLALLSAPCLSADENATKPEKTEVSAEIAWGQVFPDGLLKAGEKSADAKKDFSALNGKFVAIYHSASWCGPCRMFTPQLVTFYEENQADIEVIFISADNSEEAMLNYIEKENMKWLVAPFGKKPNLKLGGGIPELLVVSPNGEPFLRISGSGRNTPDPRLAKLREKMNDWLKENAKE